MKITPMPLLKSRLQVELIHICECWLAVRGLLYSLEPIFTSSKRFSRGHVLFIALLWILTLRFFHL